MTERQIELIENSWDYVLLNASEAGNLFYKRLFDTAPDLKPLFKGDMKTQSQKLTSMITFLVHKLNKLDEVQRDVKALGARHKNYNVKEEHYPIVGGALLWTLEQGLGDQWNEEVKAAWAQLYGILAKLMMES